MLELRNPSSSLEAIVSTLALGGGGAAAGRMGGWEDHHNCCCNPTREALYGSCQRAGGAMSWVGVSRSALPPPSAP